MRWSVLYWFLTVMLCWCPSAGADSYQELTALYENALTQHSYVSDQMQYGVREKWVASLTGDCEDFALYLQAELRRHQFNSELWMVRTETGELHVVVRIGQLVLDNRFDAIRRVKSLSYHWLAPVNFYNRLI